MLINFKTNAISCLPFIGFVLSAHGYGQGIWCGIMFVITGGLGIASSRHPSSSKITLYKAFSAVSIISSILLSTISYISAYQLNQLRKESSRNPNQATCTRVLVMLFTVQIIIGVISFIFITLSLTTLFVTTWTKDQTADNMGVMVTTRPTNHTV